MAASVVSFLLLNALVGSCQGQGFLQKPEVSRAAVQAELKGVLSEVLGHGHGVTRARLAKIRALLVPLYRSLPQNKKGHLSGQVMRYAVRRYFSQEHAWIVVGFEPHAELVNTTDDSENILKGKVPGFIRAVLEEKFAHDGFALDDVVSMIGAIERLAFDEVVRAVEASFWLNDISVMASLTPAGMSEVLASYLITEMFGGTTERARHQWDKKHINLKYPHWKTTQLFLADIEGSDTFRRMHASNPFSERQTFSFTDLVRMAERVSEDFGPWSDHECQDMKEMLVQRETLQGSGRVRIADFYKNQGTWQFTEPPEYLRQLGAIEETTSSIGPQVLIQNYVTGMSNCITSKSYYSICCLNECDQIYRHLEASISDSMTTPNELIKAVESLPQAITVSESLRAQLEQVSEFHNGKVPLHGRLVEQWLHFTFPYECPYPHEAGTITPKTSAEWRAEVGKEKIRVSDEERKRLFEEDSGFQPMAADDKMKSWSQTEYLLVASTPSDFIETPLSYWFRIGAQICMVLSCAGVLIRQFSQVVQPGQKKVVEYDV